MDGWVWKIQYEGLKQIFFKCGNLVHKEDGCGVLQAVSEGEVGVIMPVGRMSEEERIKPKHLAGNRPEETYRYGSWMMVQSLMSCGFTKGEVDTHKGHSKKASSKLVVIVKVA